MSLISTLVKAINQKELIIYKVNTTTRALQFVCSEKSSRRIRKCLIAANSPPDPQHTQMVMLTVFSTSARESEWKREKEEAAAADRRIKGIFIAAELLTWHTHTSFREICMYYEVNKPSFPLSYITYHYILQTVLNECFVTV